MAQNKGTRPAAPKRGGLPAGRHPRAAVAAPSTGGLADRGEPASRSVTFRCRAESDAAVFLAGSFNGWDASAQALKPTTPSEGLQEATLLLPPGRHEYRFVVNGAWQADPECPEWTPNPFGSRNSVVQV